MSSSSCYTMKKLQPGVVEKCVNSWTISIASLKTSFSCFLHLEIYTFIFTSFVDIFVKTLICGKDSFL